MKTIRVLLPLLFMLRSASAAGPVSIEEFKKMDFSSQFREIEKAPPEKKEELERIYIHAILLRQNGGEEGLKALKEKAIERTRSHHGIARLFVAARMLWYDNVEKTGLALIKAGVAQKEIDEAVAPAWKKTDEDAARAELADSIIYQTAETPEAIALAKQAEVLAAKYLSENAITHLDQPSRMFSKEELAELDKKADEFLAKLKDLPKISEDQLQKERDAFPEQFLLHGR